MRGGGWEGGNGLAKQPARVACSQANLEPRGQVGQTSLNHPPSSGSFPGSGSGSGSQAAPGEGGTGRPGLLGPLPKFPETGLQVPAHESGCDGNGPPLPSVLWSEHPVRLPKPHHTLGGSVGKSHRDVTLIKRSFVPTGTGFTVTGKARTSPKTHFFKVLNGEGQRTKMH